MSLKEQLERDLKQALLSGDKLKASTLRGLKSVILNEEIAQGVRDQGLTDENIIQCFNKEVKKRQEAIVLYEKAGSDDRANQEKAEQAIIEAYLPAPMNEDEIKVLVDKVISSQAEITSSTMGKVIGEVKLQSNGTADGAVIARIVKEKLQKG